MLFDRLHSSFIGIVSLSALLSLSAPHFADAADPKATKPHTPEEFATLYMQSINKKDRATIDSLRYPAKVKSEMQQFIDEMMEAELNAGTQYNRFEIKTPTGDVTKPQMGPDGTFYEPTLKPTHLVKFISERKDGSSSTQVPIGIKDGVYYVVTLVPAAGGQPAYQFGWNRFTMPKTAWSVMLPNEPEPGRAALEKEFGAQALDNPDAYGVIKNTAAIKTAQHWFWCGEEGKRVNAPENKETYRAACTTYTPETLKEWFSDAKKNLSDSVDNRVREVDGKLVQQKTVELNGAPGVEFEIKAKDGSTVMGRSYWVNDALYELVFQSKKDAPDVTGANKFLTSLEVKDK